MGQLITVTEKSSARRDIVRFETNRALTGMGHERYTSIESAEPSSKPSLKAGRTTLMSGRWLPPW